MKYISYTLILILLTSCTSKHNCKYPLDVQLYRVFPNVKFEIKIKSDSTIFNQKFTNYFLLDANKPRKFLIKNLCYFGDSMKIHFIVNNRIDTIFDINPKLVRTLYLGCDQNDNINIYHDFRNGQSELSFE
jgi:hypothetical protein